MFLVSYFFNRDTRCSPSALAPFFCVVTHDMVRDHTDRRACVLEDHSRCHF